MVTDYQKESVNDCASLKSVIYVDYISCGIQCFELS